MHGRCRLVRPGRLDFVLPRGGVITGALQMRAANHSRESGLSALRIDPLAQRRGLSPIPLPSAVSERRPRRVSRGGHCRRAPTCSRPAHFDSNEAGENLVRPIIRGQRIERSGPVHIGVSEELRREFSDAGSGQLVRISGHVQSSDGKPLQNARILLRSRTDAGHRGGRVEDASGSSIFRGCAR